MFENVVKKLEILWGREIKPPAYGQPTAQLAQR